MLHIRVASGPKQGEEIRTRLGGVLTVGRSPECRLVLDDVKSSRVHGEFYFARGKAMYRDLLSHNGSRIETQSRGKVWLGPLFPEWEVCSGDRIIIGETTIEVVAAETAETDVTNDLKGNDTGELEIRKSMSPDASTLATGEMQRFAQFLELTPRMSTSMESIESDLCHALLAVYPNAACATIVVLSPGQRGQADRRTLDFNTLGFAHASRHRHGKVTFSKHVIEETYRRGAAVYFSSKRVLPDADSVRVGAMSSCLCSPLWSEGEIAGFLHLHTVADESPSFTHGDAQLFYFLARVTSLLLSHVRSTREQSVLRAFATAGQVVAGLGHDARSILATLGLHAGHLEKSVPGLVDKQSWLHLRDDLDLLGFLARDTMERLTAGSGQLTPESIDVPELVRDVLIRSDRYFLTDRVRGRIELGSQCTAERQAWVDPHGLLLALLNCVKNATDAIVTDIREGEREGGRVFITGVLEGEGAHQIYVVSVCDDAGGIPAGICERLGTPLVSTKGPLGSGLGLYLVCDVVRRMAGKLRIATSTTPTKGLPAGTVISLGFPTSGSNTKDAGPANTALAFELVPDYVAYRKQFEQLNSSGG